MYDVPSTVPDAVQNESWHTVSHLHAFVWYTLLRFCLSEFFYFQICFLDKCLFSKASSMARAPRLHCVCSSWDSSHSLPVDSGALAPLCPPPKGTMNT